MLFIKDFSMFEHDLDNFDEDNFDEEIEIKEKDKIINWLNIFFKDKEMHCGGKIPKHLLITEKNIKLILEKTIENSMETIYANIEGHFKQVGSDSGLISDDIKLVKSILDKCAHAMVPKEYAAGMLIIYLILCEGFDLNGF